MTRSVETRPIRVAMADDSTFIRKALERMLADDARLTLVGSARSGEALLAELGTWRPDVVILDLEMPGIGGLETLDHLMALRPETRVIILSTHTGEGAPLTMEALHRGAVDFIDKQRYSLVDFAALRAVLVEKILYVTRDDVVAEPELIDESTDESTVDIPDLSEWVARIRQAGAAPARRAYDLVMIGASTGGPPTIQQLLEGLGEHVRVPVLVAQHMPVGFTHAFAERLNTYLPLVVREPLPGERALPGTVYIAPAGLHMRVEREPEGDLVLALSPEPEETPHRPSVDVLFRSAGRACGHRTIAVLLTGMGRDGAAGLARLRDLGSHTLVQDAETSIVFGMPRAAIALDAADEVLPIETMASRILTLLERTDEPV